MTNTLSNKIYCLIILFFIQLGLQAQDKKLTDQAWLISPSMAIQVPDGDFSDRFGTSYTAGLSIGYKTQRNWVFSAEGQFMFGNSIQNSEVILGSILTNNNNILNQTGNYAQLSLFQRGFYFLGETEKIFNQVGVNPNSGLSISFGAGYINHWIQFNNAGEDSPQILEEYRKGYDRYSGGFLLKQSLGYTYLSQRRRINFKLSFELLQAFTQNYREFNFDTGMIDTESHLDLLYGVRLNWYLPIYKKNRDAFYYD